MESLKPAFENHCAGVAFSLISGGIRAVRRHSQADIFDPYEKHHSTVRDACELAERLGVKNLLYHIEDKNLLRRKELYKHEGQRYYHGILWVPDDMEVIKL